MRREKWENITKTLIINATSSFIGKVAITNHVGKEEGGILSGKVGRILSGSIEISKEMLQEKLQMLRIRYMISWTLWNKHNI